MMQRMITGRDDKPDDNPDDIMHDTCESSLYQYVIFMFLPCVKRVEVKLSNVALITPAVSAEEALGSPVEPDLDL
jgi:hypothetical protein